MSHCCSNSSVLPSTCTSVVAVSVLGDTSTHPFTKSHLKLSNSIYLFYLFIKKNSRLGLIESLTFCVATNNLQKLCITFFSIWMSRTCNIKIRLKSCTFYHFNVMSYILVFDNLSTTFILYTVKSKAVYVWDKMWTSYLGISII